VVVLTHRFWTTSLKSDASVLGKQIRLGTLIATVVGVLEPAVPYPTDTEIMANMVSSPHHLGATMATNRSHRMTEVFARLAPNATLESARADLLAAHGAMMREHPESYVANARVTLSVSTLRDQIVAPARTVLILLLAAAAVVFFIAVSNVANLILARSIRREGELAVRAALGASRRRIAAELLLESLVIGLLGGILGFALAYAALQLLVSLAPEGLPRLGEIGLDGRAAAFTLLVSVAASLLFGCIPVLKYGSDVFHGLRDGGRTASHGRERHRARNALVVVQVGLAFVLLICSGLMIRTFRALAQVDPGFASRAPMQTFRVSIAEDQIADREQVVRIDEEILHRLAAIPGVSQVAFTSGVPMDGNNSNDPIFAQDKSYATGELPPIRRFEFSSPEVFATLGIPFRAGRAFTWTEIYQKLPVVVVSEGFAREQWREPAAALGKRIRVGTEDDWREIIGVVGDVRDDGLNKEAPATIYWPILLRKFEGQEVLSRREVAFVMRTPRAGTQSLMNEVRKAVWSVDANVPIASVKTIDEIVRRSMARTSFTLVMLSLAGAMALLLGAIGLYGVIAYSVSTRTREIGIRMALGARDGQLLGMFVRHGLRLTLIGVAAGLAVALAATRVMSSLLFGVTALDPLTYVAVAAGLIGIATLASYLPSRRAAAVPPSEALRAE